MTFSPPGPEPGPLALFTHLARTTLFLDALQRECLEPHGLRFTEYSVLRILRYALPDAMMAPSRIAELTVCTTGGMTKIVDRLERGGLVRRRADPDDRRGVLVELTPEGRDLADKASDAYLEGRARVLAELDPDEADAIVEALRRLLDVFEDDRRRTS